MVVLSQWAWNLRQLSYFTQERTDETAGMVPQVPLVPRDHPEFRAYQEQQERQVVLRWSNFSIGEWEN